MSPAIDGHSRRAASPSAQGRSEDGGPALFRLVRYWSRRWINQALAGAPGPPDAEMRRIQHIQVIEAVATNSDASDEVTVSAVASQLGLDQSGASRMIKDALASGYLARIDSARDRRRVVVKLTAEGRLLHAEALRWQRQCFDRLTATWDDNDRRQFAVYLQRLADETA
jgi:DNA-binding MarR family transcriptional regulator